MRMWACRAHPESKVTWRPMRRRAEEHTCPLKVPVLRHHNEEEVAEEDWRAFTLLEPSDVLHAFETEQMAISRQRP